MFSIGILFRMFANNARGGTFVLNGATPVVVPNKYVTADSVVIHTIKTVGGTPAASRVSLTVPGTSFTVSGTAGDTSTHNYVIIR